MRVLIIKMSSLGDLIHTLPALTAAGNARKELTFDWVVEEGFQEIPAWHPLVKNVIPIALRRWRKNIFSPKTYQEIKTFKQRLQENQYDLIIDAQGLLKSAFISWFAKGPRAGLNYQSAWEPLASYFYQRKFAVDEHQHAIVRVKKLFNQALDYSYIESAPDYGLEIKVEKTDSYLVFLHGTTWATKHWPEEYWIALAKLAQQKNLPVKLLWGNDTEFQRAQRIAAQCSNVEVMPALKLKAITELLAGAKAIVSVDTGLGHVAAAFNLPTLLLFGPTDPKQTGLQNAAQKNLQTHFSCSPCSSRKCLFKDAHSYPVQPPCFSTLPPAMVWSELESLFLPLPPQHE